MLLLYRSPIFSHLLQVLNGEGHLQRIRKFQTMVHKTPVSRNRRNGVQWSNGLNTWRPSWQNHYERAMTTPLEDGAYLSKLFLEIEGTVIGQYFSECLFYFEIHILFLDLSLRPLAY